MTAEAWHLAEILATAGAGGGAIALLRRLRRRRETERKRREAERRLLAATVEGVIEALGGVLEEMSILHGRVTPTELASRRALLHSRLQRARERLIRCRDDLR